MLFGTMSDVEHALNQKAVTLHAKIKYRWEGLDENGEEVRRWYDTTPGRVMLGQVLPRSKKVSFDAANKLMTKREISGMIDTVYRHCGQKETVIFCDRIMALGFHHAFKAGISFGKDDMVVPTLEVENGRGDALARQGVRAAVSGRPDHPGREVQQGGRRLGEVHRSHRRRDDAGNLRGEEGREVRPRDSGQLDLHDGALRRARFARADEAACRHARPDGEAVGRDHREPDHLQLQGRSLGARVLQLDARRPQGSGRHRAEDRELGLSHAPSGRRRAGLDRHRGGLQDQGWHQDPRHHRRGSGGRLARQPHPRPHRGGGREGAGDRQRHRQARPADRGAAGRGGQRRRRAGAAHPFGAHLRDDQRRVRQVLRARSCPRHPGQHGRGGRRDRGPVDRRAGHAAHHAHVPHRRRGADQRAVLHRVELRRHDPRSRTRTSCATRMAS